MIRAMPESSPPERSKVLAALRTFVAQWFRDGREDGLHDDLPLVTSGLVDSAGVLEIVDFVERQFGVAIEDADVTMQNCNTLSAWTDLVAARLQARASGGIKDP